jgi:cytochrome P450
VLYHSALVNHDESVCADPYGRDITSHPQPAPRVRARPHICIGAHLARIELRVSLETILCRLPGLRIAVPDSDLAWETGNLIRGLAAFPVAWGASAASQAR